MKGRSSTGERDVEGGGGLTVARGRRQVGAARKFGGERAEEGIARAVGRDDLDPVGGEAVERAVPQHEAPCPERHDHRLRVRATARPRAASSGDSGPARSSASTRFTIRRSVSASSARGEGARGGGVEKDAGPCGAGLFGDGEVHVLGDLVLEQDDGWCRAGS